MSPTKPLLAGLFLIFAAACCRPSPAPLENAAPLPGEAVRTVSGRIHTWPEAIDGDGAGNLYFTDHCEKALYRLVRRDKTVGGAAFVEQTLLKGLAHISGLSLDRKEKTLYLGARIERGKTACILKLPLSLWKENDPKAMDAEDVKRLLGAGSLLRRIPAGDAGKPNGLVFDPEANRIYHTVTKYFSPRGGGLVASDPAGREKPVFLPNLATPNGIALCKGGKTAPGPLLVTQTGLPGLKKGGGACFFRTGPAPSADAPWRRTALAGLEDDHPDGIHCMENGDALVAGFWSGKILYLKQNADGSGFHPAVPLPLCRSLGHPTDLVVGPSSAGTGSSLYVTTTDPWRVLFPKKARGGRVLEIPAIGARLAAMGREGSNACQGPLAAAGIEKAENRRDLAEWRARRRKQGRKDPVFGQEGLCGPLIFAHRGGRLEAPESTARAFRYALNVAGADVLEIDVQLTRDGRFVVWHGPELANVRIQGIDPDPDKRPEGRRRIHEFDWPELAARAWVADPGTADLAAVPRCPDRRLLLLKAFLQRFDTAALNIEMKRSFKMALGGRKGLAENIAAFRKILMEHGTGRTIVVASADISILKAFRAADRDYFPTNLAFREQVALWFRSPLLKNRVLETSYARFLSGRKIVDKVRRLNSATYVFITRFGPLKALDRCPGDEALFEILDRGVDGIMTDRPLAVRRAMARWLKRQGRVGKPEEER